MITMMQLSAVETEMDRLDDAIKELRKSGRIQGPADYLVFESGKLAAAVKRRSMDLSRALVDIRRVE